MSPDEQAGERIDDADHRAGSVGPSRTQNPDKASAREDSLSPKRSVRAKNKLQGFADTIRSKANMFQTSHPGPDGEEITPNDVPRNTSRNDKSCSSRKSVRFRSSNSFISHHERLHSSPISIQSGCAPLLPLIDLPSYALLVDETLLENDAERSNLGKTGHPPSSTHNYLHLDDDSRADSPAKKPEARFDVPGALWTPMPGTNLPLEDPFDDLAATNEPLIEPILSDVVPNRAGSGSATSPTSGEVPETADHPSSSRKFATLRIPGKPSNPWGDFFKSDRADQSSHHKKPAGSTATGGRHPIDVLWEGRMKTIQQERASRKVVSPQ